MQKSFEIRTVNSGDYAGLKELWLACFDDTPEAVDNFFRETVTCENVIATFDGDLAVGAMYLIESEISSGAEKYKAYYIYAVCTAPSYRGKGIMSHSLAFLDELASARNVDYVFLVPAEESLFAMYEKTGFKKGFFYEEKVFSGNDFLCADENIRKLTYKQYTAFREQFFSDAPLASLKEKGFNSFYSPTGDSIKCFACDSGYAVYENEDGQVTVHELFGDENMLIATVFDLTEADKVTLRKPAEGGCGVPYGMYRAFGNSPEINNAFFGIPYGG